MLGDAVYEKMHDEGGTFAVQKMQEAVMRGSRSIFWSAGRTFGRCEGACGFDFGLKKYTCTNGQFSGDGLLKLNECIPFQPKVAIHKELIIQSKYQV